MKRILSLSSCVACSALLAYCSSTPKTDTTTPVSTSSIDRTGSDRYVPASNALASNDADRQHTVYFDYESSVIKPEGDGLLVSWSQYLVGHPDATIRVEGNTDERGTREYNVALGERRAEAAAMALEAQGVPASQLSIVSYGKEHPVATGHDEDSWVQNRRDDLVK